MEIINGNTADERLVLAAADGAITIADSTVLITKATAAALTLAAPTAAKNGTKITIVATTAAAHTVTATTIGFNAGNAGTDLGTFGGAIGDGLTVIAYSGEWYVISNINVTFS